MKKITLILLLVISFSVASPQKASAQLATLCVNCSNLLTQLKEFAQDIQNYTQYIKTAKSTYDTVQKLTNTNPLTAGFGMQTGLQLKNQTRMWLMGGAQGGNPLIVQNPQAYVENSKTNELRQQIKLLEGVQGEAQNASNEGLINYLIRTRRQELGLKTGLISPAPEDKTAAVTQKDLCENGGIQRMAEDEFGPENVNDPNDQTRARINELTNSLCGEDPSQNPELNSKLATVAKSTNYFSWDNWLCITGGDCNQFVLQQKTLQNVNNKLAEKEQEAKDKSKTGYLPKTKCIEKAEPTSLNDTQGVDEGTSDTGSDGEAYDSEENCVSEVVEKPAAEVEDASIAVNGVSTAMNEIIASFTNEKSGIEDVIKGLGVGELFSSVSDILGAAGSIGQSIGQIQGAVSGLGNSSNPNSPSINLLGLTNTTYVNRSTSVTSSNTSDSSTAEERAQISEPFKTALTEHQQDMNSLRSSLGKVASYTDAYNSFLNDITTCTQNIRNSPNYSQAGDGPMVTNILGRAGVRKALVLTPFMNKVSPYRTKLTSTNTYLSTALTAIGNAKSIATLYNLQQDYQRAVSSGTILPRESSSLVDALVAEYSPLLEGDTTAPNPQIPSDTDTLWSVLNSCEQYLQGMYNRGGTNGSSGG